METQGKDTGNETTWRRKLILRLVPLIVVLAIGLTIWRVTTGQWVPLEASMRTLVAGQDFAAHHGILFLLAFSSVYLLAVAFSVPIALPLTITGGFLFGWVPGALIAIAAKTIGSLLLFFVARFGFSDFASHHAGPKLAAIERYVQSESFFYLLFMRLQPMVPFFLVNLAAALLEVRAGIFILATVIGVAPGAFISSYAGVGINDVLHANRPLYEQCLQAAASACEGTLSFAALWSPKAFIALVLLALLALVPAFGRRWLGIVLPRK